jgi:hypothetical protein
MGVQDLPCPVGKDVSTATATATAPALAVSVEQVHSCSMAFYEGRQELAIELVRRVQESDAYAALENGRLPCFRDLSAGKSATPGITDLSVEVMDAMEALTREFPGLMRIPLVAPRGPAPAATASQRQRHGDGDETTSSISPSQELSAPQEPLAFDWLVANDYFACR